MESFPSLSTDQVAAFVLLARNGSIRAAASDLHITEQGVRNRLLSLEKQLGTSLYRKSRGMRRVTPLTPDGCRFLPHALSFLKQAGELSQLFVTKEVPHEVRVAAPQILIAYVLIDVTRRFHAAHPDIQIQLCAHTRPEVERALVESAQIHLGISIPFPPCPDLDYRHVLSMPWTVITPQRHPLLQRSRIELRHLTDHPLVTYERGTLSHQLILEAFHRRNLSPKIGVETSNTDLIVRIVEAGLGIGVVPWLESGVVTKGHKVVSRKLGMQIRPLDMGVLTRKGEDLSEPTRHFINFILSDELLRQQRMDD